MNYIIGMDGGGTKTVIMVKDIDSGEIIHKFTAGALNPNGQKAEAVEKTVSEIRAGLLDKNLKIDDCRKIGIGMAGISNKKAVDTVKSLVGKIGFNCPIFLYGDCHTAIAAQSPSGNGIILIAGTGAICYGVKNEEKYRSGGYGHLIDDEGSAYDIAVQILKAVVKAYDGRGEETLLTALVKEKMGISDINELILKVYDSGTSKKDIASIAVVIDEAVKKGDSVAAQIEKDCAAKLAEMYFAVKRKIPSENILILSGSVLVKNSRIRNEMERIIHEKYPDTEIEIMHKEAALGALNLLEVK